MFLVNCMPCYNVILFYTVHHSNKLSSLTVINYGNSKPNGNNGSRRLMREIDNEYLVTSRGRGVPVNVLLRRGGAHIARISVHIENADVSVT